jgi:hypothetical protein
VADALAANLHEKINSATSALDNPYYLDINNQFRFEDWALKPQYKTLNQFPGFGKLENIDEIKKLLTDVIAENEKFVSQGVLTSVPQRYEDGKLVPGDPSRVVNHGALLRSIQPMIQAEQLLERGPIRNFPWAKSFSSLAVSCAASAISHE